MEVFFSNVPLSVQEPEFNVAFATCIHADEFKPYFISGLPLNFRITWFSKQTRNTKPRSGQIGVIMLPTPEVGAEFLRIYGRTHGPGARPPLRKFNLRTQTVHFQPAKADRPPLNQSVIKFLKEHPWEQPNIAIERERKAVLLDSDVFVKAIEFGWACRDGAFSVEWKHPPLDDATLQFNDTRRELRLGWAANSSGERYFVVIRYGHIETMTLPHRQSETDYSIALTLRVPPSYEIEPPIRQPIRPNSVVRRSRRTMLHNDFDGQAPFVSLCVRLVCASSTDLGNFRRMSGVAGLVKPDYYDYLTVERKLFSSSVLGRYKHWVNGLAEQWWPVAFQVESILRSGFIDAKELLSLASDIEKAAAERGVKFAADMLQTFKSELRVLPWYTNQSAEQVNSISQCLVHAARYTIIAQQVPQLAAHDTPLLVQKVTITPTTMKLSGPDAEQSNRVLRRFSDNIDAFIRVTFADNDTYSYHYDREIDVPEFVKLTVGGPLRRGITIAGRKFEFLAYSSSALKEHSVWFVTAFRDANGKLHNAQSIRDELGDFKKEKYCAARLGARIAQAFSATDPSVEVEEILHLGDIPEDSSGPQCMTDGIGTMSPQFANEVWKALEKNKRHKRRKIKVAPSAYQVRFQGAKGMLSVDPTLRGSVICLRPSMIKFDDVNSHELEIARAFDSPARMYLNRPLIMLLEGLGIRSEVFMKLQRAALDDVHKATASFETAAKLLEWHGLGKAFRLPSLFTSLHKLRTRDENVSTLLEDDEFFRRVLDFAINHIRRELKYKARIPVPQSWTLVGVVDVHNYLREGEIFACVRPRDSKKPIYLKGPILVTRSPVIHPGDVQVVRAIGPPPAGSPFAREELPNCVVFSIQGRRSLASCLGGGDYDGDIYNLCPLTEMHPKKCYEPAEYAPGQRKILDRPCTVDDIADFVTEYINSDLLGLIATNWLVIADSKEGGIFHPDCLKLAQLHSDAVDYPKTGMPVPHRSIPQPAQGVRPDWHANEMNQNGKGNYRSEKALGKLFRAIDLPALPEAGQEARAQKQQNRGRSEMSIKQAMDALVDKESPHRQTTLFWTIRRLVGERITLKFSPRIIIGMLHLYNKYCSDLLSICQENTLSHNKDAQLTEEEVVAGTIVAKTHVARRRKEAIASTREQATRLVHGVKIELAGDDTRELDEWLRRAWTAWEISLIEEKFGSRSWGWTALISIFEVLKEIEEGDD